MQWQTVCVKGVWTLLAEVTLLETEILVPFHSSKNRLACNAFFFADDSEG
jgi:hypothetical protein